MKLNRLLWRCWYYFRSGYATYIALPLGFLSIITTIYYLAIQNIPFLKDIFPHFSWFVFPAVVLGVPLSILIGWLHIRRSRALGAEIELSAEASPYNYKLPPGHLGEVLYPALYFALKAAAGASLSQKEREEIQEILNKFETLFRGGYVGKPRVKP